jgi:hypothetical protein
MGRKDVAYPEAGGGTLDDQVDETRSNSWLARQTSTAGSTSEGRR